MKIQEITKYTFKGKEYNTLNEIKEDVHNTLGLEVLDKMIKVCPPQKRKDLYKLLDVLCSKEIREVLTECLNITFEVPLTDYDDNCLNYDTTEINILDI